MATVKYSTRVKEYIQALTGIDDLTSQEEGFIKSAFNRRVRMAYEESRLWPRYLKEELRYSSFDNTVPTQLDGETEIDTFIDIYSANPRNQTGASQRYDWITRGDGAKILGLDDADYKDVSLEATESFSNMTVLKQTTATALSISFWMKGTEADWTYPDDGTTDPTRMEFFPLNVDQIGSPGAQQFINISNGGETYFYMDQRWSTDGDIMDFYVDGILVGPVTPGSADLINIEPYLDGEWHHFIGTVRNTSTASAQVQKIAWGQMLDTPATLDWKLEFADVRVYSKKIDANEAAAIYTYPARVNLASSIIYATDIPQYWVSYKAALTATYGDGASEVDDVPLEFFLYGVHGAYADWLRGEGQSDKAFVEEKFAQEHLQQQLEKIQMTQGSPYIWSRFSTTGSRQNRNYLTRRS